MDRTVHEEHYFQVIAPLRPLNCRNHGGRLILIKRKPVSTAQN